MTISVDKVAQDRLEALAEKLGDSTEMTVKKAFALLELVLQAPPGTEIILRLPDGSEQFVTFGAKRSLRLVKG